MSADSTPLGRHSAQSEHSLPSGWGARSDENLSTDAREARSVGHHGNAWGTFSVAPIFTLHDQVTIGDGRGCAMVSRLNQLRAFPERCPRMTCSTNSSPNRRVNGPEPNKK